MSEVLKQKQFNSAMNLYTSRAAYKAFGYLVSVINVSLQICLVFQISRIEIGFVGQLIAFIISYLITDFINGLVHIYMDNNDNYDSLAGPLIANFHLHHKTPIYKKNPLIVVYFMETGSKVWLVGYLTFVEVMLLMLPFNSIVAHILVYTGILSSVAEVSHYLCHTSSMPLTHVLAKCGLLLSKRHHAHHHLEDNVNYAFLNGFSDPVLNVIAKLFYPGYKTTTDRHFACYDSGSADSR